MTGPSPAAPAGRRKGLRRFAAAIGVLAVAAACARGEPEPREAPASETRVAPGTPAVEPSDPPAEGGLDSPPWRAAIARGVDFRAVGQEPGWSLEIDRDGATVYLGDYGTDTLSAPTPAPTQTAGADGDVIVWTLRTDGREVDIRVTARECHDTMSGEAFSHTVALAVDGRELSGCGRWIGAAADPRGR